MSHYSFVGHLYKIAGLSIEGLWNAHKDPVVFCSLCRYHHNSKIPFIVIPEDVLCEILKTFDLQATGSLLAAFPHSKVWFSRIWRTRISNSLATYGVNASQLLPALSDHGCLAFGKVALNAIHPETCHFENPDPRYREKILELSVNKPNLLGLKKHLELVQGFRLTLRFEGIPAWITHRLAYRGLTTSYSINRIPNTILFQKDDHRSGSSFFICLFVLHPLQPPIFAITLLPTTALMNFFDGTHFTSLYPKPTGSRIALSSLPRNYNQHRRKHAWEKDQMYEVPIFEGLHNLGFRVVDENMEDEIGTHLCGFDPDCPDTIRSYPGPGVLDVPLDAHLTTVNNPVGIEVDSPHNESSGGYSSGSEEDEREVEMEGAALDERETVMLIFSATCLASPEPVFPPPNLKSLYRSMVGGGIENPVHALSAFSTLPGAPDDPMEMYEDAWWLGQPFEPRQLNVEQLLAAWRSQRVKFEARPLQSPLDRPYLSH
ncbi:hypothetical protein BKA70DRAFT_1432052 [Coprinopsis sp. MPI-PUGE-AT-0042]|nr:hypothetical protein BKA70DRAFT_1432052 [Coprinopsis sp. MPI-PUGE-AT-0042]